MREGVEKGSGVRATLCGGCRAPASLWDLSLEGSSRVWRMPQWKRYFLAGLRLMYVDFISLASGFRTSLNLSPLVLTTWLSMYRISFLGACQAISEQQKPGDSPTHPLHTPLAAPTLSPPWEPWAGESSDPLHYPPSCTCQNWSGETPATLGKPFKSPAKPSPDSLL